MREKPRLVDQRVDTKLILMAAWATLIALYIYCDWFSLYRPGGLAAMAAGHMGPFEVSQLSLLGFGALMAIPGMMILLSALAPARKGRVLNLVASALYFLVNVGNLVAETWAYYFLFGLLELGLVVLIFVLALRWPRRENA